MICKTRRSTTGTGLPVRLSSSIEPNSSTRLLNEGATDPSIKGAELLVDTRDKDRGPTGGWDAGLGGCAAARMDPALEGLVAFSSAEPAPSKGVIDVLRLWLLAMDVVNEGR